MARLAACLGLSVLLSAFPAAAQNQNVTVNEQPTAEQRLAEINELRAANRHDAAVDVMQEMIEQSRFRLIGVGQGQYTDAERWCRQELLRDPALREAYRQRLTASATRALEQARLDPDPIAALTTAYQHYCATTPALEAGLELAGRLLESGDAAAASALIEELMRHPDKDTRLGRLMMLRGAAAVYLQDQERLEASREQLEALGLKDDSAWLSALPGTLNAGAMRSRPGLIDAGNKPEEMKTPLWDQPIAEVDRSASWARGLGVLPVVTPTQVFMNNGRQVIALDRASGQRLWVYPGNDAPDVTKAISGLPWTDIRAVARGGGSVCAVLGESYGITETRNPYVPTNRLACVDELTGQLRWQRQSGDVRDGEPTEGEARRLGRANLQYTHFVGTPIVARGQVFALLRQANSQGTQTVWLMSFDLADGSLKWFRHLALVSLSYSGDQQKVAPQMSLYGDTLYFTDSIATVAAIDIRTGGYRWLRVLPVGYGQSKRLTIETDGTQSAPVLTHAGLLVPLALSRDRLVLLNPDDGSTLQSFENHPTLSATHYLMDGGDGAVVVGLKSVSYWDAAKAEAVWTFTLSENEKTQGLGDVTRRFIVVPTTARLLVLDRQSGELLAESDPLSGNALAPDGEVLATGSARLYSFTTWQRSYQRLVDRVKEQPNDPTAGLALATLAVRLGGKSDAVMEGVRYAIDAIARQSPTQAVQTRERVFGQLRALAIEPDAMDDTTRRMLYDQLALATNTAAQEVAYHLDAGYFHASMGEPDIAIDHFHAVIADPAFASQAYVRFGTTRSAGVVAQQQIQHLIDRHGRSVYARYDALASARLAELKAAGDADASALAMIARQFPLSLAAAEALLEAGQGLEAQGRLIAAVGLYQQSVVRAAGDMRQRQRAVGRLLQFYLKHAQPDDATALLDLEAQRYPDLYPIEDDKALSPAIWRERIAQVKTMERAGHALAEKLATPYLLPGRLLRPADGIDPRSLAGRLLLEHDDGTLTCHAPDKPKDPLWSAELPRQAGRWIVLADGEEQLLIWSAGAGLIAALDPATGQLLWSTPLGLAERDPGRIKPIPGEEADQYLVSVSDAVVCVGQRASAKIVAIDRAGGGVLWRTQLALAELTAMDSDAWTLAAAGLDGLSEIAAAGKLTMLNLFTGEAQTEHHDLRVSVTPIALRLIDQRVLVFGAMKFMAMDRFSGTEAWSHTLVDRSLTGVVAVSHSLLAVESTDGIVQVFDIRQGGKPVGGVLVRSRNNTDPLTIDAIGGQLWVCGGGGVFRLGQSPLVQWKDSVNLPFKRPVGALIGEQHVAMFAITDPMQDPQRLDQPRSFGLYILDREGGRLLMQYTLGPLDDPLPAGHLDPSAARLFGNGIAVPAGAQTLIVPGNPGP